MRLSKIKIENFRGIECMEVELDRNITVLVGENNVGKTTLIDALRLCLDTVKSDKVCNFTEYDFYRANPHQNLSSCKPIVLTISFIESTGNPWQTHIIQLFGDVIVGSQYSVIKLRITAKYNSNDDQPEQSWSFLDDANNEMSGKNQSLRDLRLVRPFFLQKALRAAKDQYHWKSKYWASFLGYRNINQNTQKALERELQEINQKIVNAQTSFKDVTNEVSRISDFVLVGKSNAVTVDPKPADIYKALRYTDVNLLTSSNSKIPIHNHGEGTQSLSILLLFSAYLKKRLAADYDQDSDPIIAIEEPEAHLHPNAIRAVWHILSNLPGQKIVATHSGDILSEVPLTKLRRISRDDSSTTVCKSIPQCLLDTNELRMFNYHVRMHRGELFFARCWFLVEGETDAYVFAECAKLLGIELHSIGVRFVEISQAGGPKTFIKVADVLGINWHLTVDNDQGGQKFANSAKALLEDKQESKHISILNYPNVEVLLCCSGYSKPYRDTLDSKNGGELGISLDNGPDYWHDVYQKIKKQRSFSKPAAAIEAMRLMKNKGRDGVPSEVQKIIQKCIALARG